MDHNLYKAIGQRIKQARERLSLSQDDLASCMNYKSAATVSHFESGLRKVSIADLKKLSDIFGVPLETLIQGEDQNFCQKMQQFMLRANIVKPSGRKVVANFLVFAQTHASQPVDIPKNLVNSRPGVAATQILDLTDSNIPPISPHQIAQKLNVPVFDWEFPNEISGIFIANDNGVCIGVNRNHPNVRQRFTVAHELGHLIYHKDSNLLVDFYYQDILASSNDEVSRRETTANQFAADLLMPKTWIERDFKSPNDLPFLANRYGVSEQALWYRLVTLKLVRNW